jgi:hypothetical protein
LPRLKGLFSVDATCTRHTARKASKFNKLQRREHPLVSCDDPRAFVKEKRAAHRPAAELVLP